MKKSLMKKPIGIGIEVKSPFHTNDKPATKLIESQHKTSIFASQKGNPFDPTQKVKITPDVEDDYCTCERCPHCGKKIRRNLPIKPLMYGSVRF